MKLKQKQKQIILKSYPKILNTSICTFHSMKIFVFLIFISFLLTFDSATTKHTISSEMKLQQIEDLSKLYRSNIITLDDTTYPYYAINKPRPYSLIVFFDASHPKFKCDVCKKFDNEFQIVAQSYSRSLNNSDTDSSVPVFFIRLDYESSQRMFSSYQINIAPIMYHIGPFLGDMGTKDFEVLARDKFILQPNPEAETMAGFIRERTGISVPIKRSKFWTYLALLCTFGVLGMLVKPAINVLPYLIEYVQSRILWGFVSAAVYTCAISGLIFDIIRLPPMYHASPQTGQIMFFEGAGSQFVLEGFFIGFLNIFCAGNLIFISAFAPKIKNERTRSTAIAVSCACFIFCFLFIRSLYQSKNGWYMAPK